MKLIFRRIPNFNYFQVSTLKRFFERDVFGHILIRINKWYTDYRIGENQFILMFNSKFTRMCQTIYC